MITELGEVSGGVSGGKRGFLRLNSNVSLPLRFKLRFSTTIYFRIGCGVTKNMA